MEKYYLPFGAGARTCIGKHISYLEMVKVDFPRLADGEGRCLRGFSEQDGVCGGFVVEARQGKGVATLAVWGHVFSVMGRELTPPLGA